MQAKKDPLPFALPMIEEDEIREVVEVLRSGWLTTGPKAASFEQAFAKRVGAEHAIAVSSATAGLHLALEAIGIKQGDWVVTSVYTFTATAEIARYLGAEVLFLDVDPGTLNLNLQQLEDALKKNDRIRACIPVHFAGLPCPMDAVAEICRRRGVGIVEDAAHAFPATWKGQMIGTIGDATVFSFYATKTLCTGEGGMITTNDAQMAKRMRLMRLHGIDRDVWNRYHQARGDWYYEVIEAGYKYNMPDITAALGLAQLRKADRMHQRRAEIAARYSDAFADLPVQLPADGGKCAVHAWHLYVIRIQDEAPVSRDRFIEEMKRRGIGCSVHFIPLHLHPYWRDRYGLKPEDFPVATDAYRRAVSLPIYPKMTDDDVHRVIDAVREILGQ